MMAEPDHDDLIEADSDPAALLRQDVLKIFRAGAAGAAIFAIVVGIVAVFLAYYSVVLYHLQFPGLIVAQLPSSSS